ncbi:DsbA family oxidoreductase [Rheinheimera texasensis]|uniref:DsbA family oxidoreductase n=1 Tax=Rheinheimera texasensis TaxID=306205 RepID=UPI0032B2E930
MTLLRIDLVSDVACPWCAIGYARLQQALQSLQGAIAVDLHWRAFELNPDPALKPEPILPALCRKYGVSAAQMQQSQQMLMQLAAGLGVNFSGMEQRLTCNTFDAHRLLKWAGATYPVPSAQSDSAQQASAQTQLKLALFDAYFGRAEQVSEPQVLLRCVEAAGLNADAAAQVLASTQFADEVRAEEAAYQQAGISSVPAFVINQRYLISGAQEPAQLAETLRQIAAEMNSPA